VLRISKLTDYGTVVLGHLARSQSGLVSAADVAAATGIGVPTVSKLLKSLHKAELVTSIRGSHGGYQLARDPADISAADVIDALEGPVSITECSGSDSHCGLEAVCSVGGAWQRINVAIRRALDDISLADLGRANAPLPQFNFAGTPVSVERKVK
jgi:FeS assembly SUF system regulator